MTHQGSCHCGAVAFDLDGEVTEAIDCNCSMCRRRGGLLAFFPREALTLKTPESNFGTYRFNKEHIAHHFCLTCGVAPFSEARHPGTGVNMAAVNVRCLPDVDLSTLPIKQVDGASL
ncbi:MAG: GFA family protein [Luteimonas sp.]|nr:GFA family protein [Luteimonas sp.]